MNDISYGNWVSMSDSAIIKTIGEFIRHHRLNQNKTQDVVSKAAGISRSTLSLLERGETVTVNTLIQVIRVLDLLYIMDTFQVSQEISPVEYAILKKKNRMRVKKTSRKDPNDSNVKW